jgi:hypothetical protein
LREILKMKEVFMNPGYTAFRNKGEITILAPMDKEREFKIIPYAFNDKFIEQGETKCQER